MTTRRDFFRWAGLAGLSGLWGSRSAGEQVEKMQRPNILWLSCEDIGPCLGCYNDPHAHTPALDRLAAEGVRYANAFTTAGVCAPNRSSIITGLYSFTLGSHHMRSGGEGVRRSSKPKLAPELRCFPEYLREAGYYCTNNAKEDYNFEPLRPIWDESGSQAHWRNRPNPDQPFFAVFNYTGTHEGSIRLSPQDHAQRTRRLTPDQRQAPDTIKPPPFQPDTPEVRKKWADFYELVTALDYWVADMLKQLEEDGLARNTVVFFWSDHGTGLPRYKRWIYDSGTHIPLIVRIPEPWRVADQGAPGTVDDQLISSVDFAPTVLHLADIDVPDIMQGRAFLGNDLRPRRSYVFAARDRMDERYDIIRMARDKRYQYIRNYEPFKPYDQYMNTAEQSSVKQEFRRLAEAGKLTGPAAWVLATSKPIEELYDTQADPHAINNLAADPAYSEHLERLRTVHDEMMAASRDLGLIPESELVELEERYGNRYAILPGIARDAPHFAPELQRIAKMAGRPAANDLDALLEAMKSEHTSIRYWGALGLHTLGRGDEVAQDALVDGLKDPSPTVRVASAHALCMLDHKTEAAMGVLRNELQSPREWVRLQAALAFDAIGEKARPAISLLQEALKDTDNKYVVRVANHAVNVLLGTDNEVR